MPLWNRAHFLAQRKYLVDARRVSDGKQVFLKRIGYDTEESYCLKLFSSDGRQEDPLNHCVPLLEYFEVDCDQCDDKHCFAVTPLLRWFDSPDFVSVDEVLEFIRQTLEVRF